MTWVIEADGKTIGMTVWDADRKEHRLLEDGERKIVFTGTELQDGLDLAEEFCSKYIIPTAMRHGVDTKRRIGEHIKRLEWRQIIEIFMGAPADMFWPPDGLWIYNTETGETYYPHATGCTGSEEDRKKHRDNDGICGRCRCLCDCARRHELARARAYHAEQFAKRQKTARLDHNLQVEGEFSLIQAKLALSEKLNKEGKSTEEIAQALADLDQT